MTATVDLYNQGSETILKENTKMETYEGLFEIASEKVKDVAAYAKNIQTIITTGKAAEEIAYFLY